VLLSLGLYYIKLNILSLDKILILFVLSTNGREMSENVLILIIAISTNS
jgi:hypothetical protein